MHSVAPLCFSLSICPSPMSSHVLETPLVCSGIGSLIYTVHLLRTICSHDTCPLFLCFTSAPSKTPNLLKPDQLAENANCPALQLLPLPFVGILEQRHDPLSGCAYPSTAPGLFASWGSSHSSHSQATANATAATINIAGSTAPRRAGALECFACSGGARRVGRRGRGGGGGGGGGGGEGGGQGRLGRLGCGCHRQLLHGLRHLYHYQCMSFRMLCTANKAVALTSVKSPAHNDHLHRKAWVHFFDTP